MSRKFTGFDLILMSDRRKWRSFVKIEKFNEEIEGLHELSFHTASCQLWEMMANYSRLKLVEEKRHPAVGSVLESAERYCQRLPDRLETSSRDFSKRRNANWRIKVEFNRSSPTPEAQPRHTWICSPRNKNTNCVCLTLLVIFSEIEFINSIFINFRMLPLTPSIGWNVLPGFEFGRSEQPRTWYL